MTVKQVRDFHLKKVVPRNGYDNDMHYNCITFAIEIDYFTGELQLPHLR